VQIGVLSVLARLLSPRDFGLTGLALIFVGFATMVASFGVRESIVRRRTLTERDLRAGFTLAMLLGGTGTLLLAVTAPWTGAWFEDRAVTSLVLVLSATVLITNAGLVAEALLLRQMAWRRLMWVDLGSYLLGYAATGTILAALGFGPWALAGSAGGQALLRTIFLIAVQPHGKRFLFGGTEFAELFRFGRGFTAARLSNYGAQQVDNLVVGRVLGAGPLGFYSRAFKLMITPVQYLGTIVTKVLFPAMARLQHEPGQLKTAYLTGCATLALGSAPFSGLMVVTGPELVRVVLGANWEGAILPLQILSLGLMPRNVCQMSYCLDATLGAMSSRALRDGVYFLAVLGGSLAGLRYGLPGVAAGVLVAMVIQYAVASVMSMRLVRHSWPEYFESQAPGLMLGVVSVALAVPLRLALHSLGLPSGAVLLLTVGLTSALVALLVLARPTIVGQYGRIALRNLGNALSGSSSPRSAPMEGVRRELASRWGPTANP
jgi:PST family polysaccharide transporter